jgi:hypothetical protein
MNIQRVQTLVEPSIRPAGCVEAFQHRAAGAVDIEPFVTAFGSQDRRARHRRWYEIIIVCLKNFRIVAPGPYKSDLLRNFPGGQVGTRIA